MSVNVTIHFFKYFVGRGLSSLQLKLTWKHGKELLRA
jgi:hypothetical protein